MSLFTIAFMLGLLASPAQSASGICGDINGDYQLNLVDITYFINYMYLGGPSPANIALCDANSSGNINILDILYLISYMHGVAATPMCEDTGPVCLFGSKVGCKPSFRGYDSEPFDDCIEWQYFFGQSLRIKHINATFNCCPIIHTSFYISHDTIIISESETYGEQGACLCLCQYDLSYEISFLPPGVYFLRIIEPYLYNYEPLELAIDLINNPSGVFCVPRLY